MFSSAELVVGQVYSRRELAEQFGITDATLNTGIFQPKGHSSIWLFVTKNKTADRTQYADELVGDILRWDGQTQGRKDDMIIHHRKHSVELLLFYRDSKKEYDNYGFTYQGPFDYVSHTGSMPAHFKLKRSLASLDTQGDLSDDGTVLKLVINELNEIGGTSRQGYQQDSAIRKAVEQYAMDRASDYMETLGYTVEDVSARQPYDLFCTKVGSAMHVEVKGTQSEGEQVFLTQGEVGFISDNYPATALIVVADIQVVIEENVHVASGGNLRCIMPWTIDRNSLVPIAYCYQVPPTSPAASPNPALNTTAANA